MSLKGEKMIIATWNMLGATNAVYLNQVLQQTRANVLCLQECGTNFATLLEERAPIIGNDGAIIGYTGNFRAGAGFMECVYWEAPQDRLGLAVLSNIAPSARHILMPAAAGFNPNSPRAMPWCTVTDPQTRNAITIYSIHSPPVSRNVTLANVCTWNNAQIGQISQRGGTWACVGDFNAPPNAAGFVPPPQGAVVSSNRATQQGGGILDYAITNAPGFTFFQAGTQLVGASDHYPQSFRW
ncbi:hypothetical protein WT60_00760 [Burkholderia sp. MSMB617WGS]|uniref:Endonuclease/exonuclease/phosphatase domain-containing protein n=2 Tax=Burkholderiaceae TaxID=119060 RepID=A0ABR5T9R4_9BURK|nr:hypothetical protein WT60_00760 [Burkholderia sp. MSMB617WGS]KWZ40091.1 hypothetical protein WS73_22185 [Burkholderia savannae]KWZ41561.1 hypothetical protein WS72_00780 [Burkholderia savannae]